MVSSSTRPPSRATTTIPEQRQPNNCHRPHQTRPIRNAKVDCNNKSGIEVQWKNDAHRRVHFDPTMDWKLETCKAEQGYLRRLAETEFKKQFEKNKQEDGMRKIGRLDRLKEIFLYLNYCDIQLLVDEYCNDIRRPGNSIVARMFHLLFTNAGIPTETMPEQDSNAASEDERARLTTCFLALRQHFQRIFGTDNAIIWGFSYTNVKVWNKLSCRAKQALYFIHCLSPLFHSSEKDSKQRQVYEVLYGDALGLEEYLFQEDAASPSDAAARKDLRDQVYAYFASQLKEVPPWLQIGQMGADLNHIFAALRATDDVVQDSCDWQCCYDDDDCVLPPLFVPYDSLTKQSKLVLFVISSMPAFRAYRAAHQPQECLESTHCAELLLQSPFLGCSLAGTSESADAVDSKPESNAAAVDSHSQESMDPVPF